VLGLVLRDQNKAAEAEALHREALALARNWAVNDPDFVGVLPQNLGDDLSRQGRYAEAGPLYREALALARNSAANDPAGLESELHFLAEDLYGQGKYAEAESLYREEIRCNQARLGPEGKEAPICFASLGRLLADWAWADRDQPPGGGSLRNDGDPGVAATKSETPRGRAQEAERLLRARLAVPVPGATAEKWRNDDTLSRLGGALLAVAVTDRTLTRKSREAKLIEAESLLLPASEALQKSEKADKKYKRDALTRVVHLYEAWGKRDKEAMWRQQLGEFERSEATAVPVKQAE
jgi:tetratricopeptide (TPR) repeat protein